MSARWKKIWADLWSNKSRTILTMLTIAVGAFAVGFTVNLGNYMLESMDSDYLSANPSEATVYAYPLDDDMVKVAREVPGVDAAEGRRSVSAKLIHDEDEEPIQILFTGLKNPNELTVNILKPIAGESALPVYNDREVVIDYSAASLGYEIGDALVVELSNGRRRELVLAGYVHDVTGFPYNLAQMVNAYVTPKTLEWLGGDSYYNALAISVSEKQTDQEHVTAVAQAVSQRMEQAGTRDNFVSVYRPGHHFAWEISQGMFFVLGIFGYLTVLLSAFLIINTITALMTQQTRQIGIMKAVGGGRGQILAMYLTLIAAFGLGALAVAIPLANSAAKDVGNGMSAYLNFTPLPAKLYPEAVVQQAFVAVVVPLLAAAIPVYNSVRITVREAISDYGIGGNAAPKEKPVSKFAALIPRPIRLSLRNAVRRKARLALTLFTLVLAGAIFIGVYNLWASFDEAIEDVQRYILADVNIAFNRYYRFDEVSALAMKVPGVTGVEGWTEYGGTLVTGGDEAETQILFVAPPSTSTLIDPVIKEGRWLQAGDENAVVVGNHFMAMFPNTKIGDWLTIKIDNRETRWRVIGIYTIIGNVSPPLLYVNYEYLSRVIGKPGQVYSVRVLTERHDSAFQKRVSEQIQALYESGGIQIDSAQLGADFIEDNKAQTDIFVYFMLVMATMIAAVGGLGLTGMMSVNVLERTREIGVMRAIGASNADIQGIVIVEGVVVGLISWAVGIAVSIPITSLLTYGVGMAILTEPMKPVYDISGAFLWLLITLVLAVAASALPARSASRLTVRDTLAYE